MNRLPLLLALICLASEAQATTTFVWMSDVKRAPLTRTFLETRASRAPVDFDLTFDEFTNLFLIGSYVTVYDKPTNEHYREGYVYAMDVGDTDLSASRTFEMPDIEFDEVRVLLIQDPADTPFSADYPTATHALVRQPHNGEPPADYHFAEYYVIDDTGIYLIGVAEIDDGQRRGYNAAQGEESIRATFPLDETLSITKTTTGPQFGFSEDVKRVQKARMHGFGTLDLGEEFGGETLNAGAFINDVNFQEPGETDPNAVISFRTNYSIFGDDGTFLNFYVAQPPCEDPDGCETAFKGEIEITDVELWRISSTPLPVELSAFEGVADGTRTLLDWTTASETNNAGFHVQVQSGSVADFRTLGFVEGAGTTLEAQHYRFRTNELAVGRHRFRLQQEDLDGATSYSPVVEVWVGPDHTPHLASVRPHPVSGPARVTYHLSAAAQVDLAVYDLLGRRVAVVVSATRPAGTHQATLDVDLAPGVYLLRLQADGAQVTQRVVVGR